MFATSLLIILSLYSCQISLLILFLRFATHHTVGMMSRILYIGGILIRCYHKIYIFLYS